MKIIKTEEEVKQAVLSSESMSEAADKLSLAFSTFKRLAIYYNLYKPTPNQAGKGTTKVKKQLNDVFTGKQHMVTTQLKVRLVREGYKEYKCEICGIDEWNGEKIGLELDHISGVRSDNSLNNLRLLCPNCHSQTHTFRGRNIAKSN
jgi:Zn finger protein HypA/HybF involved in hydrogenase expression